MGRRDLLALLSPPREALPVRTVLTTAGMERVISGVPVLATGAKGDVSWRGF